MARQRDPSHPYPNLTDEYYASVKKALQTPMPDALPHRHANGPLCTDRDCLRQAGPADYHCRAGKRGLSDLCYDENGNFRCRNQSQGNKPCKRRTPSPPTTNTEATTK